MPRRAHHARMNTKLVLLRYDFERKAWMRAGAPVLFGEARHSSEAEARAFGEAWRGEGSNERRAYSVLTKDKPFDWSI